MTQLQVYTEKREGDRKRERENQKGNWRPAGHTTDYHSRQHSIFQFCLAFFFFCHKKNFFKSNILIM